MIKITGAIYTYLIIQYSSIVKGRLQSCPLNITKNFNVILTYLNLIAEINILSFLMLPLKRQVTQ